jgi:hypothetical protein
LIALHADGDPVIDPSDAGRGTGGSFLAIGPGPDSAFEDHLAVMRHDADPVRVDLRVAAEETEAEVVTDAVDYANP